MLSFIFGRAVVLLVVFNVCALSVISADDSKDPFDFASKFGKRSVDLTPRLGKRSLHMISENDRQALYRMLEAADTLKYYYDQMQYYGAQGDDGEPKVSKKVIFTPKLGRSLEEEKSFEVDFTPRLGRRRMTDEAVTPSDSQLYRNDPEQIESRSQYFSPRLGRGGSMTFSPRLGRSLVYDQEKKKQKSQDQIIELNFRSLPRRQHQGH